MSAPDQTIDRAPAAPGAMRRRTSERVDLIRPSRGLFDLELERVWRFRGLLTMLTARDVKVLYRQAALGAAWAIIQPIFAVIIFTIVFGKVAKLPVPGGAPYPVFVFAAVLPWNYFAECVRRGGLGLVSDAELVRKVYFPRLLIPLSGAIAPLLDLAVGFVVLLAVMLWYGVAPSWRLLAVAPLALAAGFAGLSVALWLGPINVRYRDVKHTLPFMLQIWMYASPVVYSFALVPTQWRWIFALNPMVGVIEGFRWAVIGRPPPDLGAMAVGAAVTLVLLLGGLVVFRRMERSFADVI
jgi:lipopolysaccharide transport system permease protein